MAASSAARASDLRALKGEAPQRRRSAAAATGPRPLPRVAGAAAQPRPPARSRTSLALVRGGGTSIAAMQAKIDAVKAGSASIESRASSLARVAHAKRASTALRTHQFEWQREAAQLAAEAAAAEAELAAAVQGMRDGALAAEADELARHEQQLEAARERVGAGARGARATRARRLRRSAETSARPASRALRRARARARPAAPPQPSPSSLAS